MTADGTEKSPAQYTYYGDGQIKSERIYEGSKLLSQKTYEYQPAYSADEQAASVTISTGLSRNTIVTSYTDVWGRRTRDTVSGLLNGTSSMQTAAYTTDIAGNILTSTDFNGNATAYQYDALNRLTRTDNAEDKYATQSYDYFSNIDRITNYEKEETFYSYNARGQQLDAYQVLRELASFPDILNHFYKYYDAYGNLTQEKTTNGIIDNATADTYRTTRYVYDSMNRLLATIANDGGI